MPNIEQLEAGAVGIVTELEDGTIVQLGLTERQSKLLNAYVSALTKEEPAFRLPADYDLIPRHKLRHERDY
jgi:hypothetical protein